MIEIELIPFLGLIATVFIGGAALILWIAKGIDASIKEAKRLTLEEVGRLYPSTPILLDTLNNRDGNLLNTCDGRYTSFETVHTIARQEIDAVYRRFIEEIKSKRIVEIYY